MIEDEYLGSELSSSLESEVEEQEQESKNKEKKLINPVKMIHVVKESERQPAKEIEQKIEVESAEYGERERVIDKFTLAGNRCL